MNHSLKCWIFRHTRCGASQLCLFVDKPHLTTDISTLNPLFINRLSYLHCSHSCLALIDLKIAGVWKWGVPPNSMLARWICPMKVEILNGKSTIFTQNHYIILYTHCLDPFLSDFPWQNMEYGHSMTLNWVRTPTGKLHSSRLSACACE